MSGARTTLGRVTGLAAVILVPLALWLGFADCVEVPKRVMLGGAALAAFLAVAADPAARARIAESPLGWPLGAGLAVTLVSAWFSGAPGAAWAGEPGSWQGAASAGPLGLGALSVAALTGRQGARRMGVAMMIAATLLLGYEAVQVAGADPVPWDPVRTGRGWRFATLGNPVFLAGFLVASFWVSFIPFPAGSAGGWAWRLAALAGAAATGRRTVLLSLVAGALARSAGGTAWALAATAALAAAFLPLGRLGSRPEIWAGALRILRAAPWLGCGPDLFHASFTRVATYAFFAADPPSRAGGAIALRLPAAAHLEPLGIAATQGLAGAGIYAWALVVAWRGGRRSPWLAGAVALWAMHLANPSSAATGFMFWTCACLAAADRPSVPAPLRRPGTGAIAGLAVAALLMASLAAALRQAVGQAELREAGRLAYRGDTAGAMVHEARWVGWRARARPDNPLDLFAQTREADGLVREARRRHDAAMALAAAARYAEAFARAPAVLSLLDDRADALDAAGRPREAAALRRERASRDVLRLFAPR